MAIDPGWVFLSVALAFQCSLVSLLILPAPNNNVRGAVTQWVAKLTHSGAVRFGLLGVVAMSAFYLWYVRDALLNPLLFLQDQFGFDGVLLAKKGFGGCEMEIEAFKAERNALICGASLFLWFVGLPFGLAGTRWNSIQFRLENLRASTRWCRCQRCPLHQSRR